VIYVALADREWAYDHGTGRSYPKPGDRNILEEIRKPVPPSRILTEADWQEVQGRVESTVNVRWIRCWRNASGGGHHLRAYVSKTRPQRGARDSWEDPAPGVLRRAMLEDYGWK